MTPSPTADHRLTVDLAGEIVELSPPTLDGDGPMQTTFGRVADIEIDTNRYLHRRVGAFRWRSGAWWLHNLGSAIVLEVADLAREAENPLWERVHGAELHATPEELPWHPVRDLNPCYWHEKPAS